MTTNSLTPAALDDLQLVTLGQLAARLQVHRSTIHAWTKRPDFPLRPIRVGARKTLFELRQVQDWLASLQDAPPDTEEVAT